MQSASNIHEHIFQSVSGMYQHQLFKFEGTNAATRSEFIYQLQLVNLIGQGKQFPLNSRNNWIQILREIQQPDGFFDSGADSVSTARLALTAISVATLHQLGSDIRFPIYHAGQFRDRHFTENWFRENEKQYQQSPQQQNDALICGKSILNTFTLLEKAYCDGLLAETDLIFFFNCSDAQAKPESGFWLSDSTETGLLNALIDALFRTQAYIFFGRYLPYPQKMIQSLLKMQQGNGHFTSNSTNFLICDLAAVTLLAHLYQTTRFNKFWIRRALKRLLKTYSKMTNRGINMIFQNQPPLTEAILFGAEANSRLNQTTALYYFSLIQALGSFILPTYKLATSGWNLKNTSPAFTFCEIT